VYNFTRNITSDGITKLVTGRSSATGVKNMNRTRKEPTPEKKAQLLANTYVPYSIHFIGKEHYVADANGRLIKAPKQTIEKKTSQEKRYDNNHDNKKVKVFVETEKTSGRQEVVVKVFKLDNNGKELKFPSRITLSLEAARAIGAVLTGM
jgi:hypothetical protein